MIPAGQPIDEDLEARKFANLQARREPDLTRTSARSYDIKIDESQRVFVLPTSDGLGVRAGIVAGALIIASGLTWLVISALPSPFVSASVGRSSAGLNSSAPIPASNKGDRLLIPNRLFMRRCQQAAARQLWPLLHANPNIRPTRSAKPTQYANYRKTLSSNRRR